MIGIRTMERADWPDVHRIYEEGIATGLATFETRAPDWERWDRAHLPACRLVAVEDDDGAADNEGDDGAGGNAVGNEGDEGAAGDAARGDVIGWAALSPVSSREVYAGVAEVSVYVAPDHHGRGIGRALLAALIDASEAAGIWTLQASIFPENEASVTLHRRQGFRIVGRRERIGRLSGQWRDTVLLERRSPNV